MTDIIETTLLQRISDLTRFIEWVENAINKAGVTRLEEKHGEQLLAHLHAELATEQRNLRRLQWEREIPVIEVRGKVGV